jgi:NAD(P)H-quinone oxidoreductase subunit 5
MSAMRIFATYRVSDAAMLLAAVLIHHAVGSGSLSAIFVSGASSQVHVSGATLTAICSLILVAVAGKSALLPFSGWLPRAMEGPTPSSAVYYGALSVHAGCYLLWRTGPLLEQSRVAQLLAIAAGVSTAVYAALLARVQTDVKSALSYATLTQVGIIVVEIALGLRTIAFVHMVGNACLRLVQFLTAPNVLQDLRPLERKSQTRVGLAYMIGLERGVVDDLVDKLVVAPFFALALLGQRLDRFLAGETSE